MSTEVRETFFSPTESRSRWSHLRHGLGRSLLVWFLLLSVMSLVAAGIIITAIVLQNARQATVERLSTISALKQSEIDAWVASQQEELALIALIPDIRSKLLDVLSAETQDVPVVATQEQLQEYLSVITSEGSSFEELFLLDASGRVLLSSDPSHIGASHAGQAYFVKGQEGPYFHPPHYSLYTAALSMVVAQPVQDDSGRVWGILAGRLDLDWLTSVMHEGSGLGQTGDTYLVNAASILLMPPRFGHELTQEQGQELRPAELRTEGVKRGLALGTSGSEDQVGWSVYTNYRGRTVLGIYRWLPNLESVLLTEQEVGETLALARTILATGLIILLVVAMVAVGTALLVSRRITRPIVGLTTVANLIATGDLSYQVPHIERQDEIGILARAFSQMKQQLQDLIADLERQVVDRTHQWQETHYKLQRRATQLETIALVGQAITSILNVDELLLDVVNLIRARFNFYHAGVFLIDEGGEWAVLRQATGEAGQRMLTRKHRLAVGGQSIVGWVTSSRQPRIALDVGADAVHFKNPDLPQTRSEMALPLIVGDRLLGALDVQSTQEAAFDEEDMATLSLMADQVAVALDNALKFSQEAAILEATSPLYRASRGIAMATSLDDVVRSVVDHSAGPHVHHCAIHLFTPATEGSDLGWFEIAAVRDGASEPLSPPGIRYPVRDSNLMEIMRRQPAEPLVVDDLRTEGIADRIDAETYQLLTDTLRLRAVLMLPMVVARRLSGLLLVASRRPHAWTNTELRTFRSLSDHAAVTVENIRLLEEAQARASHEQAIRQLTEQMRRAVDVETILKTTVARLGDVMGVPRVYVRLGTEAQLTPDNGNESVSPSEAGHSPHSSGSFPSSGDIA
jgi:GAF domain-containing protein/HAMP domain-containing protein